MSLTRRQVLGLGAALAAWPAAALGRQAAARAPICFSTLGCPKWSWGTVLDNAAEHGYVAIELRGLQGEMDLTKRPEFEPGRIGESLADLRARGLRIASVDTSVRLHEPDRDKMAANLDTGRRHIDLASRLGAPFIRVFPDALVKDEPKATTAQRIAGGLRTLADHARGSGVTVLLESHGAFTDSPTLGDILRAAGEGTGLLWDTHHTVVSGKETPAETFRQLGPFVRHTHLKDSTPEGDGVRYVLTGEGTIPLGDIVKTLVTGGYDGLYSFEWEKAWHPEIAEPEIAIPHFAKVMRGLLAGAGG